MALDYLVIGHATLDAVRGSRALGGTAAYAARTARALGCKVGVVTSVGPNLDPSQSLGDVQLERVRAPTSTVFENVYLDTGRRQVIHSVAAPLTLETVPEGWTAQVVHVGPVAGECDPALVTGFEGAFIGVTPQGWMRTWDDAGYVGPRRWKESSQVLPHADAVVLSEEDVRGDEGTVVEYARETGCLALTQGAAGCTIYAGGEIRRLPAPNVDEVDPTGAGDIFAASFFYALQRGHDPWVAARFANCIAARSVTRQGLCGTPLDEEVAYCRRLATIGEGDDAHYLRAG